VKTIAVTFVHREQARLTHAITSFSGRLRRASPVFAWASILWRGINASRATGLAAQMAFWLFLSLLPLAAVSGLVVARIAVARADVTGELLGSAPYAVRDLVTHQLEQVAQWNGGTVAPLAAVVFVWLAASGVHAVFDALDQQTGQQRPWWKKRLLAIAGCVALSIGIATLALLRTGLGWLYALAGHGLSRAAIELPTWSWVGIVTRLLFGGALAFGLVAGLYAVGTPRARGRRRVIVPGALLAVAIEIAAGLGYGEYLRIVGTGNAYQAGLGVVGVTLTFLYVTCLALLIGSELNQSMARMAEARRAGAPLGADQW
jgi:membrane protein